MPARLAYPFSNLKKETLLCQKVKQSKLSGIVREGRLPPVLQMSWQNTRNIRPGLRLYIILRLISQMDLVIRVIYLHTNGQLIRTIFHQEIIS